MELRSGVHKGVHGVLPEAARPAFAEAVNIVFSRWTALCLAIDNEWGGRGSRAKAEQIYNDVLAWFHNHKEHYADDLEVDLEQLLLQDFNLEAQDDSCRQVAITLVSLHQDCLQGNYGRVEELRASMPATPASSQREQGVGNAACSSSSGDDDGSTSDEEMEGDDAAEQAAPTPQQPAKPAGPVIDEDGFQMISRSKGRRAR